MSKELLTGIEGVFVPVSDPEVSARWYQETLGCELRSIEPDAAVVKLSSKAPTVLCLVRTTPPQKMVFPQNEFGVGKYINFLVEDFDAVRQTLKQKNVSMGSVGGEGSFGFFTFYDPDGNPLGVCQSL
ncbi:catechol 2,3-dioxygenase-like lactoylglutathione lyase family enzyme [Roseibium hamelinense]|uniref:Catechol 2,3-dioxygenase-like lactoylglutathione lyase family enzyme n=1 Tax=Roseibium hamelinense TaxID=150831 RepID=A0A562TI69_9HYPH|nr:VOC family protein [Roseibium hamelinense]TWI93361.1 catechol 2,3-dioxygenase-like lactoylglutathione lyase family enzyme [Roseibium hamelinense]